MHAQFSVCILWSGSGSPSSSNFSIQSVFSSLSYFFYYYYLSAFCYNLSFETRPDRAQYTAAAPSLTTSKGKCELPTVVEDKVERARERARNWLFSVVGDAVFLLLYSILNVVHTRHQPAAFRGVAFTAKVFFFDLFSIASFHFVACFDASLRFYFNSILPFLRSKNTGSHSTEGNTVVFGKMGNV